MRPTAILGVMASLILSGLGGITPSFAAGTPEILHIPFAPPVNTELRYAVTRTKISSEKSSILTMEETHLFTPSAKGYVLTIRTTGLSVDGDRLDLTTPAGQQSIPHQLRPFLLPVEVDVGGDGSLVRLHDWPRLREALAGMPDTIAATEKTPGEREEMRKMFSTILAPLMALTAEQAAPVMLKTWAPLFGYGGGELEAGEVYEGMEEVPSPLLPVKIPTRQRQTLSRTQDGHLRYQLDSQPDQEQAAAVTQRFLRQMGGGLAADKRANLEKAVHLMKTMRTENHLDLVLNASSGIVERATTEMLVSIEGAGNASDKTTVTRLN